MKPILSNSDMVRAILDGRKTQDRRPIKHQREFPDDWASWSDEAKAAAIRQLAKYQPGDVLYVRETFQLMDDSPHGKDMAGIPEGRFMGPEAPWKGVHGDRSITWKPVYRADGELMHPRYGKLKWKPNIHMPKWAARIFLKVTKVRVERIQDISAIDVLAEGVNPPILPNVDPPEEFPEGFEGWSDKRKDEYFQSVARTMVFCRYADVENCFNEFTELWDSIYPGSWERNDWVFVYEFKRCDQAGRAAR